MTAMKMFRIFQMVANFRLLGRVSNAGAHLSKICGEPKYLGKGVAITDEIIGVSQLLRHVPGLPQKSRENGEDLSQCR